MRKHAIVLLDVERHQSTQRADAVERVKEEPLMFQGAPPRFDHGVRALQFREGQDETQHSRADQVVDLGIHALDACVRQYKQRALEGVAPRMAFTSTTTLYTDAKVSATCHAKKR